MLTLYWQVWYIGCPKNPTLTTVASALPLPPRPRASSWRMTFRPLWRTPVKQNVKVKVKSLPPHSCPKLRHLRGRPRGPTLVMTTCRPPRGNVRRTAGRLRRTEAQSIPLYSARVDIAYLKVLVQYGHKEIERNQRMFGEMNAITVEKIKKNRPKNTTKTYNPSEGVGEVLQRQAI
jgi:hypothetical protein